MRESSDHRHNATPTLGCRTPEALAFGGALLVTLAVCSLSSAADGRPAAASQPAEESVIESIDLLSMEIPTVVTASRREQKITTVPYAMTVITAEDIRRSGARSVPDALRLAAGVDVAELSHGNYAVSPRGFHGFFSDKVVVLVDGRQIYDTIYGGTPWGNWAFQLEDVDRIEVIRGPGGVTWGANAVNGVINVITKDPKDQLGLTAAGGGGSRGTSKEHVGYAFEIDKLRMRISSEYEGGDGFKGERSFRGGSNDEYDALRANVHAVIEPTEKDSITLSGGSAATRGNWPALSYPGQCTRTPQAQSNFLMGRWNHEIEKDNNIDLTGYVNDFYGVAEMSFMEYRYQQFALELSHAFKPADRHTVTWGVDTRWDLTSTANSDPSVLDKSIVRSGDIGLYAQDEWRFADRWALNLGGRVDYDFYGGFQPSGRAALSYELTDKSMVYGAVSRAFHMPPGGNRLLNMPVFGPFLRTTFDREVDAEQLVAYELGYHGKLWDRLDMRLNGFWHSYDDLVTAEFKPGPPGFFQIHNTNRLATGMYGAELELRWPILKSLTLMGNYTFETLDSGASLTDSGFLTLPKHKFMVGVRHDLTPDLHLDGYLHYVSGVKCRTRGDPTGITPVDGYFRLDLRAEYEFWHDRASIAVGVRNLLDPHHPEGGGRALDPTEVPRMVYAEMRMAFK